MECHIIVYGTLDDYVAMNELDGCSLPEIVAAFMRRRLPAKNKNISSRIELSKAANSGWLYQIRRSTPSQWLIRAAPPRAIAESRDCANARLA